MAPARPMACVFPCRTFLPLVLDLADSLVWCNSLGAAEAHYRMALTERPDDATAAFNLGVCLEDLGRLTQAIEIYQKAIAIEPDFPDPYYNVARLLERTGNHVAAIRHLKTFKKLTEER